MNDLKWTDFVGGTAFRSHTQTQRISDAAIWDEHIMLKYRAMFTPMKWIVLFLLASWLSAERLRATIALADM